MAEKPISVISFPQNTCGLSNLSWSDDSRLAIATDECIVIVDPFCSPSYSEKSFNVRFYTIPADKDKNIVDVGINLADFKGKCTIEQEIGMVADHTLTMGQVNVRSPVDVPICGFVKMRWSPLGADVQNQCVLATLSLDHRLHLCYNRGRGRELQKAVDISQLFYKYHKKKNFTELTRDVDIADKPGQYAHMLHRLAAVDMCWSHVLNSIDGDEIKKSIVLFMLTKAGDVVTWRIKVPVNISGDEPQLLGIKSTNINFPTFCHWCQTEERKGYLCVAYNDGRVKAIVCTFDGVTGNVSMEDEFLLWEHTDRLACTDMLWKKQESALFVVKENFLLKFDLDLTEGIKVTSTPAPVVQHDMQIVGLSHAGGSTTITASEDRTVNMYLHEHGQSGVVHLPHVSKLFKCHGVALSRNGHLLALLQSPNHTYNHLKERTALKLIFTSFHSPDQIADILLQDDKQILASFSDVIEDLRRQIFSGQALPTRLQQLLAEKDSWEMLTSFQKKLIRFLTLVLINSTPANDENMAIMEDLRSNSAAIEKILLRDHIRQSLNLLEKEPEITKSERDKAIALAMHNWLQKYDSSSAHHAPSVEDSSAEKCPICEENLEDITMMVAECPRGHGFARCCVTMVICDDFPYRTCYYCNSLSLPINKDSSWAAGLLARSNCTLCDGLLL